MQSRHKIRSICLLDIDDVNVSLNIDSIAIVVNWRVCNHASKQEKVKKILVFSSINIFLYEMFNVLWTIQLVYITEKRVAYQLVLSSVWVSCGMDRTLHCESNE